VYESEHFEWTASGQMLQSLKSKFRNINLRRVRVIGSGSLPGTSRFKEIEEVGLDRLFMPCVGNHRLEQRRPAYCDTLPMLMLIGILPSR
jgi:hypothetical protein